MAAGSLDQIGVDVVVVGGGQSGLAVAYHLHRLGRGPREGERPAPSYVVLDDHPHAGGAWQDGWESLHLFSPASHSSLAGWPMPPWTGQDNPDAAHVTRYLAAYEQRYDLPVRRPVHVTRVERVPESSPGRRFRVRAEDGRSWAADWVVSATGTWSRPFWPHLPGIAAFAGRQLHTADYRGAQDLAGLRVLVVGGGNSGAQVAADLLPAARSVTWSTKVPPRMLPDDVDGRVLFETATRAVRDRAAGIAHEGVGSLGDVVAVPSVRHARDELGLAAEPMPERLVADGAVWPDGTHRPFDAVVWCTGFRPALRHLAPLGLTMRRGRPVTTSVDLPVRVGGGTRRSAPVVSADDPHLLLVGYGDWCGDASATLIGVNRAARDAVDVVRAERPAAR